MGWIICFSGEKGVDCGAATISESYQGNPRSAAHDLAELSLKHAAKANQYQSQFNFNFNSRPEVSGSASQILSSGWGNSGFEK